VVYTDKGCKELVQSSTWRTLGERKIWRASSGYEENKVDLQEMDF